MSWSAGQGFISGLGADSRRRPCDLHFNCTSVFLLYIRVIYISESRPFVDKPLALPAIVSVVAPRKRGISHHLWDNTQCGITHNTL